ncbi:citrate synthase [uncultured Stenotrophomonas sp.]|uniref:citrate synthase n=1 Tax=uncultured Stenotrophomonas sp. TaxID=165438 RepID=UPI0025F04D4A|nr:citrate synthase [uncultured Stenotrophomonas sp.]
MSDLDQVTLNAGDKSVVLPVIKPTLGNDCVDIAKLTKETGYFTYDSGFTATASCKSAITYIDGDKGVLLYRGYPIEQLSEKSSYVEVAYLLINGERPSAEQLKAFTDELAAEANVDDSINTLIGSFAKDAHPMAILTAAIAQLSGIYHASLDLSDAEQRRQAAVRLIAKVPTLSALIYRHGKGLPANKPDTSLDYVSRFLKQTFESADGQYDLNPDVVKALDLLFILHADHEQNASTSTVRLAGSSGANPFACIAAGIACLWGPSHGGANEEALTMLKEIGTPDKIPEFIQGVKDRKYKLMGFGHRVYKNYDPRAKVMQQSAYEVLAATGRENDPLFLVAKELEKVALSDEYFTSRKLFPNVDFYSGITLSAMGFPTTMFTVLFALARTVGWISQWQEMMADPSQKIGRPRQLYTGPTQRDYVPIEQRG